MDLRDLIDLYLGAVERVEFFWHFYSAVIIAIVGWLASNRQALSMNTKTLMTLGYLLFATINLCGLWDAYTFAAALHEDLIGEINANPPALLTHARFAFSNAQHELNRLLAILVHLSVAAVVLTILWRRHTPDRLPQ